MPGCRFGGEVEWSLGGNAQSDDRSGKTQFWVAQAKKRWVAVDANTLGVSTTLGTMVTEPALGDRPADKDFFVNVPVTFLMGQDRVLHVNAGWVNHQTLGVNRPTWGVGGELPLSARTIAIAETFGESTMGSRYQVGLRMWLVPQRVQIYTTYGNRVGHPEGQRWFTVGVRLLSPAFLP